MLELARVWVLRNKNNTAFDDELTDLIAACKADLRKRGVVKISDDDPLIKQAVKLYCKAQFGYGDDGDKYAKAYEYLKCALALSGDYNH